MADFYNGGLTNEQVAEMQRYYGTAADGMWGKNSTSSAGGRTAQEAWQNYQNAINGNSLRDQYASALQGELASLENAYKQNTLSLDKTAQELPKKYQEQRNILAAANAMERKSFDERANAAGLNTGTSGQAQLASSGAYQRGLADIGAAEATAQSELDLERARLKAEYENAMASARAQNEIAMQEALMEQMRVQPQAPAAQTTSYNNGGLSSGEVKVLQNHINAIRAQDGLPPIAVDGKWGTESSSAVGGLSAKDYSAAYEAMLDSRVHGRH